MFRGKEPGDNSVLPAFLKIAGIRAVRALLLETIYAGSNCKINEDFCAQK